MKFRVLNISKLNKARVGLLDHVERLPKLNLETPVVMLYTKGGSIPHITHEVLQLITTESQAIQVPLVSTVQFIQPMAGWDRPLADFVGLTDYLTYVTIQDPGDYTPPGYHKEDAIPIWTKAGKVAVTVEKYMEMLETFKPDMFCLLSDGDTNMSSSKKRVKKSVDQTINFFTKCCERINENGSFNDNLIIAPIAGGYRAEERRRCIQYFLNSAFAPKIGGFLIDGLHNNGPEIELINFNEVKTLLTDTLSTLPDDKLRAVHGCWNPLAVIELVTMGVDVFDSSFPYIVTERSAALTFNFDLDKSKEMHKYEDIPFEINLRDSVYANSFESLLTNCQCLACRKHTRAYIYHLLNVQELLGSVLLTIHNLHHYLNFFKHIRAAIKTDRIDELKALIKCQYDKYQASLLAKKEAKPKSNNLNEFNDEGDTSYNNSEQIGVHT